MLTQPLAEHHVLGDHVNVAAAQARECVADVARHGLVALPRARVHRLVQHGAGRLLVAAVDHGDVEPLEEQRDLALEFVDAPRAARRVEAARAMERPGVENFFLGRRHRRPLSFLETSSNGPGRGALQPRDGRKPALSDA